jgi:hypothetical protein
MESAGRKFVQVVSAAAPPSKVTVFPAGKKQAKVALPACILIVDASEVSQHKERLTEEVGEAVSAGATGVLLEDSEGTGGTLLSAILGAHHMCSFEPCRCTSDVHDVPAISYASGSVYIICSSHAEQSQRCGMI